MNENAVSRRTQAGVRMTWVGVVLSIAVGALYVRLGSPISGYAIATVGGSMAFVQLTIPPTVPLNIVSNVITAILWLVTFLVGYRTGGFASPVVVWAFFHPITAYILAGRRSAAIWSLLSVFQVVVFFAASRFHLHVHRDLSSRAMAVMRTAGFLVCIIVTAIVLYGGESVRQAAQKATEEANQVLERQRILGDMHDGVGSQLLGLMIQLRAKKIDDERLLQGLASCLDDLRLIVDSLDPLERSFEVALGEFRERLEPRCAAANVELVWDVEQPPSAIRAERTLQVLRALQEMTNNALRHAQARTIVVRCVTEKTGPDATYSVSVRDDGIGFVGDRADDYANDGLPMPKDGSVSSTGRGLTSLRTRAQRLGGEICYEKADPGTLVTIRFPLRVELPRPSDRPALDRLLRRSV